MAANQQRLPNLKICVDNTESTDESDVGIKSASSSSESDDDDIEVHKRSRSATAGDGEVRVRPRDDKDLVDQDQDVLSISVEKPTERRFLSRKELARGSKSKNIEQQAIVSHLSLSLVSFIL